MRKVAKGGANVRHGVKDERRKGGDRRKKRSRDQHLRRTNIAGQAALMTSLRALHSPKTGSFRLFVPPGLFDSACMVTFRPPYGFVTP